jgi:phosphohistidine phosphatase
MKRELVLIRHTKSSWSNFSMPDFERPLKKDRVDDAKRMAEKLKELQLKPDLIICSPAVRTKQTACYFCDQLKYDEQKIQFDKRLYESSAEEYMSVIRETDASTKTLVVIGHNPSITDFVNIYLKATVDEVPTTGVVWFEFETENWEICSDTSCKLKFQLSPKAI